MVYFSLPEATKAEGLTTDEENSVVVINGEVLVDQAKEDQNKKARPELPPT